MRSKNAMTYPLPPLRGLVLASLTLTALPAMAGEIEPLGDTTLEATDRDEVAATSASYRPGVRHDGRAIRVGFDPADAALVGPPLLELETAVSVSGRSGTFTLTFDGQTTTPSHFDGRFLSARDLTREQGYRMDATSTFGFAYTYELYQGGVRVAVADVDDGVAPFVLEGVDRTELVHRVDAVPSTHGGEHIEIHSWSLGTMNATFDDGGTLVVDHVVVRGHELGHIGGLHHIGPTTAQASGVAELRAGVEDLIVPDQRDVSARIEDVRSVFLLASATGAPRKTTFTPPTGHVMRVRSGRDGAKPGAWSAWSTSATIVSATPTSDQAIDDFEVELQRVSAPTVPPIRVHGYVKIKKLNSGG
jgi:hypothetical protein